jgi:hypothetical protein
MVRKEFIESRRGQRTLAVIIAVPVMLLVIFGYAASFQVHRIPAELAGHDWPLLRSALGTNGEFAVRPAVAAAGSDIMHGRVGTSESAIPHLLHYQGRSSGSTQSSDAGARDHRPCRPAGCISWPGREGAGGLGQVAADLGQVPGSGHAPPLVTKRSPPAGPSEKPSGFPGAMSRTRCGRPHEW